MQSDGESEPGHWAGVGADVGGVRPNFLLPICVPGAAGAAAAVGPGWMSLAGEPQVNLPRFHMINPDNCALIASVLAGIPFSGPDSKTNSSAAAAEDVGQVGAVLLRSLAVRVGRDGEGDDVSGGACMTESVFRRRVLEAGCQF